MNHFILGGIIPIDRSKLSLDIVAGITLAALAIPEVMGYTKIAGMPVVTGLYTILVPTALFAIFGSSRHLVVGADSATAAIMAASLSGIAVTASPQYVAYAGILALMAAGMLILARIIKLGFIADFLSRTVLIGFLTGVGIQVAISQVSGMLGIPGGGGGPVQYLISDFRQLDQANPYTIVISLCVLGIIIIGRRINKKIPGPLIAVIGSILLGYLLNLSSYGVEVLGTVPGGLPNLGLPKGIVINIATLGVLLPIAFSMFIVIIAQSAATSRAYAARYNEKFSENEDLVGLGLANIGAGITGTFVVNGSPTKTQMVDSAGGRSQLATLITTFIVLIILLLFTQPLAYMPSAVLSSVVFLIGIELINLVGMHRVLQERPVEFWVALITTLVVVFVGVEQGILLAIVLSIVIHTRHGYKPKNALIGLDNMGKMHSFPVTSYTQMIPGLMIYRLHHSLYYANTEHFTEEVSQIIDHQDHPLSWLCLDLVAVDDIDFTAAQALREINQILINNGIRMVMAEIESDVRNQLERSGLIKLIGLDGLFDSLSDVEREFKKTVTSNSD